MAQLKTELEIAGLKNVQTYIQSGNLIFESELVSNQISELIESVLAQKFSILAPVFTFKTNYLKSILEKNPFFKEDPKKVAIGFLSTSAEQTDFIQIENEQFEIDQNCIYIYYPSGMGKSKFTNKVIEARLGLISTMRNLNTCNKLVSILKERESN